MTPATRTFDSDRGARSFSSCCEERSTSMPCGRSSSARSMSSNRNRNSTCGPVGRRSSYISASGTRRRWLNALTRFSAFAMEQSKNFVGSLAMRRGKRSWSRRHLDRRAFGRSRHVAERSYVGDGGKRAALNDWLGHEVGPSSEFPQRPCGRSGENQKPASRRFRSTPTVPDDRQTPQPALTGPRSRLPQSITEMILSRRPNWLLHAK
jgi:hypothetical protein